MLDTPTLVLLVILVIVLVIALFIQFRYLRPKRDDAIEIALDRDDAYNAMTTAQAVSATLKDKGRDTSGADRMLIEAELAYNRGDYLKCTDASKRAKDSLATAPMVEGGIVPVIDSTPDQPDEPLPEQPKISEARKLPPNYLESKFMIETTKDDIDKCAAEGKDVSASVCLLDEAKMAFECKEYDVALRKSLKAKKATEISTEPVKEKIVEIAPPIKTVKRDIVNDSSKVVLCANCGAEALPDDNFCAKCGKPIERKRVCPTCKADVSEDDVFCRKCGTEVRTAYQCPECGFVATDDDPVCVKCGARFQK
jgi:ribosomal protein L40E